MMRFHQTRRNVAGVASDRSGASAVEMAFVMPVAILLLVGFWEIALMLLGQVLLEGALRDGARYGITGYAEQGSNREDSLRNLVYRGTQGYLDPNRLTIITRVYPSFGSVGDPAQVAGAGTGGVIPGDTGAPGMGAAGQIVLYVLSYDWEFMTGLLTPFFGSGSVPLRASIVVKNEPWGAGATAPPIN